jgi:hypothetical protein
LVFVDEITDYEISQPRKQDLPGRSENRVDNTNEEDENILWQKEAIAEDRRLYNFGVILWKYISKARKISRIEHIYLEVSLLQ